MLLLSSAVFFQISFFKKFFQEHYPVVVGREQATNVSSHKERSNDDNNLKIRTWLYSVSNRLDPHHDP